MLNALGEELAKIYHHLAAQKAENTRRVRLKSMACS